MKHRYCSANEAAQQGAAFCGLNEAQWEKGWMLIAPWGDATNNLIDLKTGAVCGEFIQRCERSDGDALVADFNAFGSKVRRFFAGVNLFHGHPEPDLLRGARKDKPVSLGLITELEAREDGLWGKAAVNEEGKAVLESTRGLYPSVFWWIAPDPKGAAVNGLPVHRPYTLKSVALVKQPNLAVAAINNGPTDPAAPAETNQPGAAGANGSGTLPHTMNKQQIIEALRKAGLTIADSAPEADILAGINSLHTAQTAAQNAKAGVDTALAAANARATTAETALAAANGKVTELQTALAAANQARLGAIVDGAVLAGKITQAEKPLYLARLSRDEATELAALNAMQPRFNTGGSSINAKQEKDRLGAANNLRKQASALVDAKFEALTPEQKASGRGMELAWTAAQNEKPELFRALDQLSGAAA